MCKVAKVILPIILTLILLVTGCQPSPETSAGTSPTAPVEGTQVGDLAPDFQLQDLDGQTISLSDLRGKPVLLNFWATWCGPCVHEMPFIQEIYELWTGKSPSVMVLTVNVKESSSRVKEFMKSYGLSFPVLLDTKGSVAAKYNIRGIPTTFLIDKDGIVQGIKVGAFRNKEEIEASIRMVLP